MAHRLDTDINIKNNLLYIDPFLPEWLPELRLESHLPREQRLDIHFWREAGEAQAELTEGEGIRLMLQRFIQAADPGMSFPPPMEAMIAGY